MSRLRQLGRRIKQSLGLATPPKAAGEMQVSKAELAQYLPADPVVVEAGAHRGQDTLELARRWPAGKICAFEPVPALFADLQKQMAAFRNVQCFPCALAARSGRQTLNLSAGASDGSSSLLPPEKHLEFHPEVTFGQTIEVEALSLDDWAARQGVSRVDLLWLDLQGSEPEVLRASSRVLDTVRAIHTEVSLAPVYRGAALYPEFRAWLESRGFKVAREFLPYPDMGNVLFVRDA